MKIVSKQPLLGTALLIFASWGAVRLQGFPDGSSRSAGNAE